MTRFQLTIFLTSLISLFLLLPGCQKKEENAQENPMVMAPQAELALAEIPDEVIATVYVPNPNATFQKFEKQAGLVAPVAPGTLNSFLMAGLLQMGLKDTSVIDLNQPVGVLILDPKKFGNPFLISCTIQDEDKILESLQPTWKSQGAKNGIHELTREEVDTYGVFQGGSSTSQTIKTSLFLKFTKKTMFAAMQPEVLRVGIPILQKLLPPAGSKQSLGAALYLDHFRKAYQSEIAASLTATKQALAQSEELQTGSDMEQILWIAGWLVDKCFSAVEQTKRLGMNLSLEDNATEFEFNLIPEKDSFFEKLLKAQNHESLTLAKTMPSQGFLVMAFNFQWDLFKSDLIQFSKEMWSKFLPKAQATDSAKIQSFEALMADMLENLGDEVALSENLDTNGINLVEIFSIKDEEKIRPLFKKLLTLCQELFKSTSLMGSNVKIQIGNLKDLEKYQGVQLQSIDTSWDLSAAQAAGQQLLKKMYGDKMHLAVAIFDKKFALAIGKNANQELKNLIDRAQNKSPGFMASESLVNAAGGLEKEVGGFLSISISQLMNSSLEATLAMLGKDSSSQKLPPTKSGLFVGLRSSPEKMTATIRLPSDHLKEIGESIKAMTQLSTP